MATASAIASGIRQLFGLSGDAVNVDPDNPYRYYILDGPNMDAFEWDVLETPPKWEQLKENFQNFLPPPTTIRH